MTLILTDRAVMVPLSQFSVPDEEQINTFISWLNDDKVVAFSEQRHATHTADTQKAYWGKILYESKRYWLLKTKTNGKSKLIGAASADFDENNQTSNASILIGDQEYWGKGYGTEIFSAVVENERLSGMKKVEAGMLSTNIPMIKVCLACGMQQEALIPAHFKVGNVRVGKTMMGVTFE